jgi:hypothetical protein
MSQAGDLRADKNGFEVIVLFMGWFELQFD